MTSLKALKIAHKIGVKNWPQVGHKLLKKKAESKLKSFINLQIKEIALISNFCKSRFYGMKASNREPQFPLASAAL